MASATFKIWRGEKGQGDFKEYKAEVGEGMVVLDVVHQIQAEQANDLAVRWNCKAGKCGSCSAEINGMPKLMCMTRMSDLDTTQPITVEPLLAFPNIRDLVTDVSWNYRVKKEIKKFKPRAPDAPDGTWRMQQEDIERVQEFRKCIECFLCQDVCHVLRAIAFTSTTSSSVRASSPTRLRGARDAPVIDTEDRTEGASRSVGSRHRLLQHHQVLHQGVPREHHDHGQRDHPAQGARRRSVLRSDQAPPTRHHVKVAS